MSYQNNSMIRLLVIACLFLVPTVFADSNTMTNLESGFKRYFCGIGTTCLSDSFCTKNIQRIASMTETGKFDLRKSPIQKNQFNIKTMTFQKISASGFLNFPNTKYNGVRQHSGLLAMPDNPTQPLKGIVIYFHGTSIIKSDIPSNQGQLFQVVAGLFGANNYAVLFPDYPGLGDDSKNVHPYVLYPKQIIMSANYLLNKAIPRLKQKYGSKISPLPVFSNGYSEGGAYSVWFGVCNSKSFSPQLDSFYKIVAISGSEGAYDTVDVVSKFLFAQVGKSPNDFLINSAFVTASAKPALGSLALLSYATYNPNELTLKDLLLPDFYNMACTSPSNVKNQSLCLVDNKKMNIQQALSLGSETGNVFQAILNSALSKQNNGYSYFSGAKDILHYHQNSLLAVINKDKLLTSTFDATLADASLIINGDGINYPVFTFSLAYDSVVSPLNTQNFNSPNKYYLSNSDFYTCPKGSPIAGPADHLGAYIVSHVFVLNFFEKSLKNYKAASTDL